MRTRFRVLAAAGIGALALALAGCGSSTTPSSTTLPSVAPGLNNNSVTLLGGVQIEPNNWFPETSTSTCSVENGDLSGLMYMPLIYITKTDGINYQHGIASGITPSNGDKTYTITLNKYWHWSNGQPVTSADVVFAWNVINWSTASNAPWTTCGIGIGGVGTGLVKSVTADGPYTVVVQLNKPAGPTWFEHNGLAQIVPVPASVWDKYPTDPNQELSYIASVWNDPTNPNFSVVDGPYKFQSYVNNEYWSMVANPAFSGQPKPKIKRYIFEYETSSASVYLGLRKGTFATAGIPNSYYADRFTLEKTYKVEEAPYGFCFNYMVLNQSPTASPNGIGAAFDQTYVRQAMQMGIDQTAIIKDLEHGMAVPTYGPVPSVPPNKYYDPNIPKMAFNPAAGKKLLEQHGWHEVNGVMTKGNLQLKFQWLVVSGSNTVTDTAELIQTDWAKEGIQVTIKEEPFNQVISISSTPSKSWAAAWWGGGWCYEPDYYPSGDGLLNEPSFDGGYNSKTMDQLITASVNASSPAQARQTLDAYQVYAASHVPVLYLPTATGLEAIKPGLYGVNSAYNPITVFTWLNDWRIGAKNPPIP